MLNVPAKPDEACHIPRHLAQSLFSAALQSGKPEFGLVIQSTDRNSQLMAPVGDESALRQVIRACETPILAIYQTHFQGDEEEIRRFESVAAEAHAPRLYLGLATDTEGRIEIRAFLFHDGRCIPIDDELEEDGHWPGPA